MMNQPTVTSLIDADGVARVTLQRPEKHNAFDDAMVTELRAVFEQLATEDHVQVVVLASTGKNFSAGADLAWMKRMAEYDYEHNLQDARSLAAMLKALNELPQPTIARVQGAAFGGAVGLVSCCDMAVADQKASFCLSEVKIGLIPATISPYVIGAIGERAARRYFTTAERFSAADALAMGLVSEVADTDDIDTVLQSLVTRLLDNQPLAVRAAKQLVADVAGRVVTPALIEDTCVRIAQARVSKEGQKGLSDFLNERS